MRTNLAILALVCLTVPATVHAAGCGRDDAPLALSDRLWKSGEAPDSARLGERRTILEVGDFVDQIAGALIRATPAEAEKVLSDAGFTGAAAREYQADGQDAVAVAIRLRDSDAASAVLQWSNRDALAPCPRVCNIDITELDVHDIPKAWGVRRVREKGAPGAGPSHPFESYEVSFVDGVVLYVLSTEGAPGSGDGDALVRAAKALYDRVQGRPLP